MSYASAPVLWTPSAETVQRATITRYARWLQHERGVVTDGYAELWEWSTRDIEGFWASIWDFFQVRSEQPYERVLQGRMPDARWFEGSTVNYARHLFEGKPDERVCLLHCSELRQDEEVTWGQLRALAGAVRAGLLRAGVGRGDRVAAYMGNLLETLAAMLATASIGAIWSCVAPEMGVGSAVDRLAQIEPAILLAVDGYRHNGKDFDRRDVVAKLERSLPSVRATVVLDCLASGDPLRGLSHAMTWQELVAVPGPLEFEPVPFSHPLWVLYSSGTTGPPKAIVHGHGGILLEHLKKLHLHTDLHEDDRFLWFSTTGWMMWNFLVSGLLTDASIVLYDGSPLAPDMYGLWDLVARTGTTIFGTSAGYLSACMGHGLQLREGRELSALRALGSTGSPLTAEGFDWAYDQLGPDLWLFSTSGGTDVCSSFLGGVPTLPVRRGELQARALGAKVEAFDPDGHPLIGEVGELVLTQPMPSMPLFFWGDEDRSRLRESYFADYPGVWRHGDWVLITPEGGAVIHGRSDATINRGGVRLGTAEIYRALQALPEIADALVVDVPRVDASSWLGLFVVLRDGAQLDNDLRHRIAARLREHCSPRHVPDRIEQIEEAPRTLSGKLLEIPVKRILMGAPVAQVANLDALANPRSLDPFVELAQREPASLSE